MLNYKAIFLLTIVTVQATYGSNDAKVDLEKEQLETKKQYTRIQFTYLDIVNPSIVFQPTFFMNQATYQISGDSAFTYPIFGSDLKTPIKPLPGYQGSRCIIEVEMAQQLSKVEKELEAMNPNTD